MIRFGTRLCGSAHFTDLHDTNARLIRKMSQSERAARLDTHRVRIGSADGILLNLSSSGALVRMPRLFPIAADATLSLYADDRWFDLKCKVVRCTETDVQLSGATWKRKEFETAVSFDDPTIIAGLLAPEGRA
jgi:hypothetical protein